jgi:cyclophilin family peptidyl-prolyl cis-trans isomerase
MVHRVLALLFLSAIALFDAGAESQLPFSVPSSADELPKTALIETTKGAFEVEFFVDVAPITVKNFEYLAKRGFYNSVRFHRYMPGYLIQGGDPTGTGKGGPGYRLPPEFSKRKHQRGVLGMARRPDPVNPERLSDGSQFYIMLTNAQHLDGLYTVFGRVVEGMEIVEQLRESDKITLIRLPRKP